MRNYLTSIYTILKKFRGRFSILFVFLIIGEVLLLTVPYFTGKTVDALTTNQLWEVAFISFIALLAMRLIWLFIYTVQGIFEVQKIDLDMNHHILKDVYKKLATIPVGQTLLKHSGLKQTVLNKGISGVLNTAFTLLNEIIPNLLRLLIAIIGLFFIHIHIGIINLITFSITLLFIILYTPRFYKKNVVVNQEWDETEKEHSEFLRHASMIKLSGNEEVRAEHILAQRELTIVSAKRIWLTNLLIMRGRDFVWTIGTIGGLILTGYYVHLGFVTIGQFVTASLWISILSTSFGALNSGYRRLLRESAHIHEYNKIMEESPIFEENGMRAFDHSFKMIKFNNITFAYPAEEGSEKNTFYKLQLSLESGKTYALVGHSGAGKTTIIQLLLRAFDPNNGSVEIDDVNLKDIDIKEYRRSIGYVEQQVELFDKSLKYNILFGVTEDKKEEAGKRLNAVAKLARIDQFFDRLENGYDTVIGEKGVKLSGGERQRVGIARALIKNPSILIFDEATSSLDAENEALIHDAMKDALKGRTVIIIAHRLSTVRDADQIIVMNHGQIAGMGTHDELAKTCEPYKRLISRQVVTM